MDRIPARRRAAPAVAVALALLAWGTLARAESLRTLELHQRSAAELAATLQPLLEPGEAAVAHDPLLILKASPARLDELETLARSLDRAAARLRIHVRQTSAAQRTGAGGGIGVAAGDGAVRVRTPGAPDRGVTVYGAARARTQTREAAQFVAAVAGQPAHIAVGVRVPVDTATYGPVGIAHGTRYEDVSTGFWVTPRLAADTVTLEIDPHGARLGAGGEVHFAAASTTVSGPLGEWLPVAGSVRSGARDTRGVLASAGARGHTETVIEMMVEPW